MSSSATSWWEPRTSAQVRRSHSAPRGSVGAARRRARHGVVVCAGKTMAEKVVRYMEEKLRQKDSVIEKLRLKNAVRSRRAAVAAPRWR